ncbi:MAG: hypothetical protein R3F54_15060 [Alphaproteobacteria bacterium]
MLDLLTQLGMADATRQMKTAKKTTLAGYMTRLFAAPPSSSRPSSRRPSTAERRTACRPQRRMKRPTRRL